MAFDFGQLDTPVTAPPRMAQDATLLSRPAQPLGLGQARGPSRLERVGAALSDAGVALQGGQGNALARLRQMDLAVEQQELAARQQRIDAYRAAIDAADAQHRRALDLLDVLPASQAQPIIDELVENASTQLSKPFGGSERTRNVFRTMVGSPTALTPTSLEEYAQFMPVVAEAIANDAPITEIRELLSDKKLLGEAVEAKAQHLADEFRTGQASADFLQWLARDAPADLTKMTSDGKITFSEFNELRMKAGNQPFAPTRATAEALFHQGGQLFGMEIVPEDAEKKLQFAALKDTESKERDAAERRRRFVPVKDKFGRDVIMDLDTGKSQLQSPAANRETYIDPQNGVVSSFDGGLTDTEGRPIAPDAVQFGNVSVQAPSVSEAGLDPNLAKLSRDVGDLGSLLGRLQSLAAEGKTFTGLRAEIAKPLAGYISQISRGFGNNVSLFFTGMDQGELASNTAELSRLIRFGIPMFSGEQELKRVSEGERLLAREGLGLTPDSSVDQVISVVGTLLAYTFADLDVEMFLAGKERRFPSVAGPSSGLDLNDPQVVRDYAGMIDMFVNYGLSQRLAMAAVDMIGSRRVEMQETGAAPIRAAAVRGADGQPVAPQGMVSILGP